MTSKLSYSYGRINSEAAYTWSPDARKRIAVLRRPVWHSPLAASVYPLGWAEAVPTVQGANDVQSRPWPMYPELPLVAWSGMLYGWNKVPPKNNSGEKNCIRTTRYSQILSKQDLQTRLLSRHCKCSSVIFCSSLVVLHVLLSSVEPGGCRNIALNDMYTKREVGRSPSSSLVLSLVGYDSYHEHPLLTHRNNPTPCD